MGTIDIYILQAAYFTLDLENLSSVETIILLLGSYDFFHYKSPSMDQRGLGFSFHFPPSWTIVWFVWVKLRLENQYCHLYDGNHRYHYFAGSLFYLWSRKPDICGNNNFIVVVIWFFHYKSPSMDQIGLGFSYHFPLSWTIVVFVWVKVWLENQYCQLYDGNHRYLYFAGGFFHLLSRKPEIFGNNNFIVGIIWFFHYKSPSMDQIGLGFSYHFPLSWTIVVFVWVNLRLENQYCQLYDGNHRYLYFAGSLFHLWSRKPDICGNNSFIVVVIVFFSLLNSINGPKITLVFLSFSSILNNCCLCLS